jgi:hypothetical protein
MNYSWTFILHLQCINFEVPQVTLRAPRDSAMPSRWHHCTWCYCRAAEIRIFLHKSVVIEQLQWRPLCSAIIHIANMNKFNINLHLSQIILFTIASVQELFINIHISSEVGNLAKQLTLAVMKATMYSNHSYCE